MAVLIFLAVFILALVLTQISSSFILWCFYSIRFILLWNSFQRFIWCTFKSRAQKLISGSNFIHCIKLILFIYLLKSVDLYRLRLNSLRRFNRAFRDILIAKSKLRLGSILIILLEKLIQFLVLGNVSLFRIWQFFHLLILILFFV